MSALQSLQKCDHLWQKFGELQLSLFDTRLNEGYVISLVLVLCLYSRLPMVVCVLLARVSYVYAECFLGGVKSKELILYLWRRTLSPRRKNALMNSNLHMIIAPELGLQLSLPHLSARELTIVACVCGSLEVAASRDVLWKALWRKRYDSILWSVPELLRSVDTGKSNLANPMVSLRVCLKELQMPPCWWISEPRKSYLDQVVSFQEQLGPQKRWKAFYFAFGSHWPKWAVSDHNHERDCWLVIRGTVFDMTNFDDHPGRREPFMKYAGLDATEAFEAMGHSYSEKTGAFGAELIVPELQLPREGNILRPAWLLQQESVPTWKDFLFRLVFFDVHCKLSYHDFW